MKIAPNPMGRRVLRRGAILVPFLVALVVLSLIVSALSLSGARGQQLMEASDQGARAQYAAESVAAMAIKELKDDTDHDGDGSIGGVSDDSNSGTNPVIGGASAWATRSDSGTVATITARGQHGSSYRAIEVAVETGGSSGAAGMQVFFSDTNDWDVYRSAFNDATSTWGAATLSAATSDGPRGIRAASMGTSTIVATQLWDDSFSGAVCDSSGVGTYSIIDADMGPHAHKRVFDVAVEPVSKEGLIAYFFDGATQLRSRSVVGGTIGTSYNISAITPQYLTLVPLSPSSDAIVMILSDTSYRLRTALWNGTSWGSVTTRTSALFGGYEEFASAVEATSGKMVVAWSNSTTSTRFGYNTTTDGSSWSASAYRTGLDGGIHWMRMAAQPGTNNIFLLATTGNSSLYASVWNGSSWTAPTMLSDNMNKDIRAFDVACSPDGSKILAVYHNSASTTQVRYRTYSGGSWSSQANAFTISGNCMTMLAKPGTSGTSIVGVMSDSDADVIGWSWNGTSFGTRTVLGRSDGFMNGYEFFSITGAGAAADPVVTDWSAVEP